SQAGDGCVGEWSCHRTGTGPCKCDGMESVRRCWGRERHAPSERSAARDGDDAVSGSTTGHVRAGARRWTAVQLSHAGAADFTEGLMTIQIGREAVAKTLARLTGTNGIGANLPAALIAPGSGTPVPRIEQMRAQNVPAELAERSEIVKYPAVNVFCQKIVNDQREKFRRFSGRILVAVEVRYGQDRLDGIESRLECYVDAAVQTLEKSSGDWGDGIFY